MKKKEQQFFIYQLMILSESGTSLGEALELVFVMEKSKRLKKILARFKDNLAKGISLSRSLGLEKKSFDQALIAMVRGGERSGNLPMALRQIYESLEKSQELKKKIMSALVYPIFIGVVTLGMALFLVMFIFPKIIPLFSNLNLELPFLTRLVGWLYQFLLHYGFLVVGIIFLLSLFIYISYLKNRRMKYSYQAFFLGLPVVGENLKKFFLYQAFREMALLLQGGEQLSGVLLHSREVTRIEPYREAWQICHEGVLKGSSLSYLMKNLGRHFPYLAVNLVAIGEKTGSLNLMFDHLAKLFEEELDSMIKRFTTMIEPVLMIGMGLIVGSLALSIILPIYEITNHLTK